MPKIPGVNHLDAVRALEKAGFSVVRQGKHIVMSNGARILTIPRHNPVNAFTLGGVVRDAGLTVEQFRELLQANGAAQPGARSDRPPAASGRTAFALGVTASELYLATAPKETIYALSNRTTPI